MKIAQPAAHTLVCAVGKDIFTFLGNMRFRGLVLHSTARLVEPQCEAWTSNGHILPTLEFLHSNKQRRGNSVEWSPRESAKETNKKSDEQS